MIFHGRIGKYKAWEIVIFSKSYQGPGAIDWRYCASGDHAPNWSLFIALRNYVIFEGTFYDIRHTPK